MLDHKYKVFYHLAQTPNTTKVAEELLLSQPAISKNIKELEKELGITLFNRIKGRMQLTEAGQYLYSEIEILVRKEREINFRIDKTYFYRHTSHWSQYHFIPICPSGDVGPIQKCLTANGYFFDERKYGTDRTGNCNR